MHISVIILAAGKGRRMEQNINKQFLEVNGKPILSYTIEAFVAQEGIDEIVLVINPLEEKMIETKVLAHIEGERKNRIRIAYGGKERYNSVYNGLIALDEQCEAVLIHDGARPLISRAVIEKTIQTLKKHDGCLVGVKAKDTYKIVGPTMEVKRTVCRDELFQIQTPQGFKKHVILEAYKNAGDSFNKITDDGMMVEQFTDYKVIVIEGEYRNIKVTTPEDLEIMKTLLKK